MGTRVNGVSLDDGAALSDATPAALGVAAAGVSAEASRADHVHALPTIPALSSATPQPIGTASAGVSTDAARADHVHAPDTALQSAPDTGWTAAGDGTAAIASGVAEYTVTAAQSEAVLRRDLAMCSPHLPAIEMSCRLTVTTVPVSGTYYAAIGAISASTPGTAGVRGIIVQARNDGRAYLYVNEGGWVSLGSASLAATLTSGELWLRLVYSAGGVAAFVGSGATRPTSWTAFGASAPRHALSGPGLATHIIAYAGRDGGGSGDLVAEIADIQWRSLLGAPS